MFATTIFDVKPTTESTTTLRGHLESSADNFLTGLGHFATLSIYN